MPVYGPHLIHPSSASSIPGADPLTRQHLGTSGILIYSTQ